VAQAAVPLDLAQVGWVGKRKVREREKRRGGVTGRDGAVGNGVEGDGIGARLACSVCFQLG